MYKVDNLYSFTSKATLLITPLFSYRSFSLACYIPPPKTTPRSDFIMFGLPDPLFCRIESFNVIVICRSTPLQFCSFCSLSSSTYSCSSSSLAFSTPIFWPNSQNGFVPEHVFIWLTNQIPLADVYYYHVYSVIGSMMVLSVLHAVLVRSQSHVSYSVRPVHMELTYYIVYQ